ncbi:hypothetical protein ACIPJN_29825 [Streptomyces sp. NPDC086796]|uniref:hypothetical protein n=1 Tax=Streptomyces sp. NPDC086796 TaxID=3365760 RepID=UPI003829F382
MSNPPGGLPADPSHLHLLYMLQHDLHDDPHGSTVERWEVSVRHGHEVHVDPRCPRTAASGVPEECLDDDCPAYEENGVEIGQMVFFKIRFDGGMNPFWAMEEESHELYQIGNALLDPDSGDFTEELDQTLEPLGTELLIMDKVTLGVPWRGYGLGPFLAAEAIHRLKPGCRAIACSPGISERRDGLELGEEEWERITARIVAAWESVGFRLYRDNVYLMDPASVVPEEQLSVLRAASRRLAAEWRERSAPVAT